MKKYILILLMPLLFAMSVDAQAQEWDAEDFCCSEESCYDDKNNFYVKIFSGANFLQNSALRSSRPQYHTGYVIAGSLGYCWCYGLRLEGEYAFRRNLIKKIHFFGEGSSKHGHFQTSSYMANVLWELPLSSLRFAFGNISPFVGAGIGYDSQKMHSSNSRIIFNQKWHHFAWQLMAGLACPIYCNTEMTLEYKFHQGGCHFYNHSLGVGLMYKFDPMFW